MKKPILLFCVLLFIGNIIYAQQTDSLRYKYNNQTIYRYGGWFLKGSNRFTFRDLQGEFSMSDLGLTLYTKAKRYKTTSTILRYVSMFAAFASIAVIGNNGNRNTAYILMGGQFALMYGGIKYTELSQQSLDRALWQRNKDLLFPQ